jgi:hypothetical protein
MYELFVSREERTLDVRIVCVEREAYTGCTNCMCPESSVHRMYALLSSSATLVSFLSFENREKLQKRYLFDIKCNAFFFCSPVNVQNLYRSDRAKHEMRTTHMGRRAERLYLLPGNSHVPTCLQILPKFSITKF